MLPLRSYPMRVLLLLLASLAAPPTAADTARARLDAFSRDLDAVRGSFVQEVRDGTGRLVESSSGTLALRAPRQFRWEYEQPFTQLIVADGDNVWIYDPDLAQVTVRAQSLEEAQSPLSVLTDLSLLERDYRVSPAEASEGIEYLRLEPRSEEASLRECLLGFGADGLARMVLLDQLGQRNELRFGRWERNPRLDDALFAFVPPEGVDVVGEPVAAAEAFPIRE